MQAIGSSETLVPLYVTHDVAVKDNVQSHIFTISFNNLRKSMKRPTLCLFSQLLHI